MKIHELKILPKFFGDVESGEKTFEIRKNDRDYQVGDLIRLKEFDAFKQQYTGNETGYYKIIYITSFQQKDGYVVMGIKEVQK